MRKDFEEVVKRNASFADKSVKQGTLIHFQTINELELPKIEPLELWDLPRNYKKLMDENIEYTKQYFNARKGLPDDAIPWIKPFYGIAEHSAFVGGKVVFGGNTSYHEHPLTDWNDIDKLEFDENNEHFKMLIDSMKYLKERSEEEKFVPALRGVMAPMDMANAIRGNDLFYDLYEEEENVHKLCEKCLTYARKTMEIQSSIVGQIEGGVVCGFGMFLPGHSFGQISEDASGLCSKEMYEEYGESYLNRLIEDYEHSYIHIHSFGKHIIPAIAKMEKITFVQIELDPNQPSSIEVYKEFEEELKDKIVIVKADKEEIRNNLEFLGKYKNIIWPICESLSEANEILELVESIRYKA